MAAFGSLLLFLIAAAVLPAPMAAEFLDCSGPASGCKNGLWSTSSCQCECISPFCRDAIGDCTLPNSQCDANPWKDCTRGIDCPWWNDPGRMENCVTGSSIPPGVWNIHASREICCNVEHAYSTDCMPQEDTPPTRQPTPLAYEEKYEVVPIKFSVSGLPDVVNMRELKDEMLLVLKRVLLDLAERVADMRITKVEENLVLSMASQDNVDGSQDSDTNRKDVYFDISVVRHPNRQFGPVIIAGLRDNYETIIEELRYYANLKYFGYSFDLNWCTDENGRQTFEVCTETTDEVTVGFRFVNLPKELDAMELMRQMIAVYEDILSEGVERLEIVGIEGRMKKVTSVTDEGSATKDFFFDITLVQKFGVTVQEFEVAINDKLLTSTDEVLDQLQLYTDSETELDLNWCINSEGAYAVCPVAPLEEEPSRFALPNWAIITLTCVSVVLACCICCCCIAWIRQRDESKNERNMMSYLQTGQNYSKDRKHAMMYHHHPGNQRRPTVDRPRRPRARPRPPSHKQRMPKPAKHRSTRSTGESEATPRVQRMARDDTEYQLANMPTFVFNEDDRPRKGNVKSDTEYELENMPTFVFNHDDEGKRPPRQLQLTAVEDWEENYVDEELTMRPDPDGSVLMIENGKWFVDEEESVLPPSRRR